MKQEDNVSKLTPQELEELSNWLWNNCDDCGLMLEDMTDSLRYCDENPADLDPSELEDWLLETRLFALDDNCPKGIKDLPKALGALKGLKAIVAQEQSIQSIPKEICEIKGLEVLDLFDNELTQIPQEIGKLESLRELYLSGNNITSLPENIKNLQSLEILCLNHNPIKALPEWLSECKNLKCIEVDDDVEIPSCIDSTLINADYEDYSSYDYR